MLGSPAQAAAFRLSLASAHREARHVTVSLICAHTSSEDSGTDDHDSAADGERGTFSAGGRRRSDSGRGCVPSPLAGGAEESGGETDVSRDMRYEEFSSDDSSIILERARRRPRSRGGGSAGGSAGDSRRSSFRGRRLREGNGKLDDVASSTERDRVLAVRFIARNACTVSRD